MRPQDVAILLKIIAQGKKQWQLSILSSSLFISLSEISESLNRSRIARLIDYNKKHVNRESFMEFLEHGVKYVFPQEPGAIVRGIPTAHAHPDMKKNFVSEMNYVWPDNKGDAMGAVIEPFYPRQAEAAKQDEDFYKLLALTDAIRVGKVREIKYAITEMKKMILHEPSHQYS